MDAIIFSDGASKGNPGLGGWGAVVVWDGKVHELGGAKRGVTNNQMELEAVVRALELAHRHKIGRVTIYCDSKYVIDGISKWIHGWRKNGWKTKTGSPVANSDLWRELFELAYGDGIKIEWKNVGGHIGIAGNVRVDEIASKLAEGKKAELYSGALENYGIDIYNLKHDESLHAAKSSSRSRSKARAHSYVSEVDGVVKVHKTWAECEARVRGKKARFKKATSPEEERSIIGQFSR